MDTITAFCFAQSVNAMDAPNFAAPIIEAMEATLPTFILFKHFLPFRKLVLSLPPWLAIRVSPQTAGLTQLQVILGNQVKEVTTHPESLKGQPHPIIYHRLLDPEVQKGHPIPNATSLYEEAQALMFGGGDTVGNALMIGLFHILSQAPLYERLRSEVLEVWPNLDSPPTLETLETLPLLTGAIKEALRMSPNVCSPCLRKVPATGATIANYPIPGGTIVGASSVFVHSSSKVFQSPDIFDADRWLAQDTNILDQWLVAFSKGPRSCLGINLAWCEMYIALATMLRRFNMRIDGTTLEDLVWRDCFIPHFYGRHLRAWCQPVKT
jgi:cytochrome P450